MSTPFAPDPAALTRTCPAPNCPITFEAFEPVTGAKLLNVEHITPFSHRLEYETVQAEPDPVDAIGAA